MLPSTDNMFSLFCTQFVGGVPPNATNKKLIDSLFKILVSYQILDIYSYMNDTPLCAPTTSKPVPYNKKTVCSSSFLGIDNMSLTCFLLDPSLFMILTMFLPSLFDHATIYWITFARLKKKQGN